MARPRPYFSQRGGNGQPVLVGLEETVRRVRLLAKQFDEQHLFSETLGFDCCDGHGDTGRTPQSELEWRVGKPDLWTAAPMTWSDADLCDFIEVFHDLAARPRTGWWHSFGGCGWHPSTYGRSAGQEIYRAQVNALLDSSTVGLRLAESGDDRGRMVHVVSPALAELIEATVHDESPSRDSVAHAVALFRGRSATRADKRSAIVELAAVLEERKTQLRAELLTKDEDALFFVANKFDLRHRRADQLGDYADEFLDWIFHWYLATVRLTDDITATASARLNSSAS